MFEKYAERHFANKKMYYENWWEELWIKMNTIKSASFIFAHIDGQIR